MTDLDGTPETMLIVLRAGSAEEASAFMTGEHDNGSGVFARITVCPWLHVLPETDPGALAQAIVAERARSAHVPTSTEHA